MENLDLLKQLREETLAPVQECRQALAQAGNDLEKAKEVLRKRGQVIANKKMEREAKEGLVDVYLHPNKKMGVLLELRCESDFAARNPDFQTLAHELCLQIGATNPFFVKEEDISPEFAEQEKRIFGEQMKAMAKSPEILAQALEGKWKKRVAETCLLEQPWVKDESKKVKDLITETIAKLGENILVKRFNRFSTQ